MACRKRRGDPRIHERQYLSLRRLSQHRRGREPGQAQHARLTDKAKDKAKDKAMRPFIFDSAATPREAIEAAQTWNAGGTNGAAHFLAGGTTLIDLMKLAVMRPDCLIDI